MQNAVKGHLKEVIGLKEDGASCLNFSMSHVIREYPVLQSYQWGKYFGMDIH